MSEEITDPVFSIFEPMLYDKSHSDYQMRKYTPQTNNLNATSIFEWRTTNHNEHIWPSRAYFKFRFNIIPAAGGSYAAPTPPTNAATSGVGSVNAVGLVNGTPFFQRGEYSVNGKMIEQVELLGRTHYINNLLDYSNSYSNSVATSQAWYLDQGTGLASYWPAMPNAPADIAVGEPVTDATIQAGIAGTPAVTAVAALDGAYGQGNAEAYILAAANQAAVLSYNVARQVNQTMFENVLTASAGGYPNKGFYNRCNLVTGTPIGGAGAKAITVLVPLARLFGFCKNVDRVFLGHEHMIRLTLDQIQNYIMTGTDGSVTAGNVPTINWLNAELWMPVLTPTLRIQRMIAENLSNNIQTRLNWESSYTQMQLIYTGATPMMEIQVTRKRPRKVVYFLINQTDLNNFQGNPCHHQSGNITSCHIEINGRAYPQQEIECDFANQDLTRIYNQYLDCCDKFADYDGGVALDIVTFGNVIPLYCFNLTKLDDEVFNHPTCILRFVTSASAGIANNMYICATVFYEIESTIGAVDGKVLVQV